MRVEWWRNKVNSCEADCPGHQPGMFIDLAAYGKRIEQLEAAIFAHRRKLLSHGVTIHGPDLELYATLKEGAIDV